MVWNRNTVMWRAGALLGLVGAALVPAAKAPAAAPPPLDVVISGGRVMDPATNTDRLGDVGIRNGRIVTTSGKGLQGKVVLDARGKVVAPGFVDILASTHAEGDRFKVTDGVTTVISTHGGPIGVAEWVAKQQARGPLVNYGTVVGHFQLRAEAGATDGKTPATPEQVNKMVELADRAHQEGALGVGFGVEYVPGTSGDEVVRLAAVAARYHTSVHAHIRLPHLLDPFQGINELIAASAATGARVQVVHIGSMAIRRQKEALELIDRAHRRGVDIAADVYPYDAWMTRLQSALFDEGWQQRLLLDYNDLVWVATGEKITAESFPRLRAQGGFVACHQIPEAEIELALRHPLVSVASDGFVGETPSDHPRSSGTFSRVLGRYVRERKALPLMTALRKMTIQPVQRLEPGAPALKTRGRLSPGMDADITVFDPQTVIDRSTFQNPRQASEGITHVLVNGTIVVRDGRLLDGVTGPGRPILGVGATPVRRAPRPRLARVGAGMDTLAFR